MIVDVIVMLLTVMNVFISPYNALFATPGVNALLQRPDTVSVFVFEVSSAFPMLRVALLVATADETGPHQLL